jgi:hypothetical protein
MLPLWSANSVTGKCAGRSARPVSHRQIFSQNNPPERLSHQATVWRPYPLAHELQECRSEKGSGMMAQLTHRGTRPRREASLSGHRFQALLPRREQAANRVRGDLVAVRQQLLPRRLGGVFVNACRGASQRDIEVGRNPIPCQREILRQRAERREFANRRAGSPFLLIRLPTISVATRCFGFMYLQSGCSAFCHAAQKARHAIDAPSLAERVRSRRQP